MCNPFPKDKLGSCPYGARAVHYAMVMVSAVTFAMSRNMSTLKYSFSIILTKYLPSLSWHCTPSIVVLTLGFYSSIHNAKIKLPQKPLQLKWLGGLIKSRLVWVFNNGIRLWISLSATHSQLHLLRFSWSRFRASSIPIGIYTKELRGYPCLP